MITLDFETTGLLLPIAIPLEKQPHIIEATICLLDDKTLEAKEHWTSLIYPGDKLPADLKTQLTDKMLNGQPTFPEVFPYFVNLFLGERIICAHNCAFEIGLLEAELRRIGKVTQFPWPPRRICTVEASVHIKGHRLKLGDLYTLATKNEMKGAHRTEVDVQTLNTCLRWLVKKGHIKL